ncbi:MAG TPA: hypothetical protein DIW36_02970 [Ruminococcaceae bacterium]|nr:hypothetical protein [Oscillospiraceae bacterium]
MFDDDVSVVDIVDTFLDDIRVLLTYLNVILVLVLCAFPSSVNFEVFNIFAWITFAVAIFDVILTVLYIIAGFFTDNIGGSIASLISNVIEVGVSIWFTTIILNLFELQLPLIFEIAIAVTIFCIMSLLISTITRFGFASFIENIRLILIFAILVVGMYNIFQLDISAPITQAFNKLWDILVYFIAGILIVDVILCIVDLIIGEKNFGDFVTQLLNIIVFVALVAGTYFAEEIFAAFSDIVGIGDVIVNWSFNTKLFVGFSAYVITDLTLAVPINLVSNIVDLVVEVVGEAIS